MVKPKPGTPPNAECEGCGQPFFAWPYRLKSGRGRFCSFKCAANRPERKTPAAVRFWRYVDKRGPGECWNWTGYIGQHGYGTLTCPDDPAFVRTAHTLSYEIHHARPPKGLFVCHRCNNRRCVNPAHLYLGTPSQNQLDRRAAGNDNGGERNGRAKLTDEQFRKISADTRPGAIVAKEFGVSRHYVYQIRGRATARARLLNTGEEPVPAN